MLEGTFNIKSKSCVMQLQSQLRNFRKDSLSFEEYFARLTAMAEELREAGVVMDEGELSLIALSGLDRSYDLFVTTQTARMDDIVFSLLLGLVRVYESRLSKISEIKGMATTNIVQSSSSTYSVPPPSEVVCQICEKKGHTTTYCFNRHNEQRFPIRQSKPRGRFQPNKKPGTTNTVWYPDSGTSDHVTGDPSSIQTTDNVQSAKSLTMANGKNVPISSSGSSNFIITDKTVAIKDILLAPTIAKNLLSVSKLCSDNDVSLRFDKHNVYLKDHQGSEVMIGKENKGLYQVDLKNKKSVT